MHSSCTARWTIYHLRLFAVVSHSAHLAAVVSLQRHLAISTKLPRRSPLRCLPRRATKSKCFNQTLHFQCLPCTQGLGSTAACHPKTPRTSSSESHTETHNQLRLIRCFQLAPMCMLQTLENLDGTHTHRHKGEHAWSPQREALESNPQPSVVEATAVTTAALCLSPVAMTT